MKKTVVFEFPDDFKFPSGFSPEMCSRCPLFVLDDGCLAYCFLYGDDKGPCQFYCGGEIGTKVKGIAD